MFIFNDAASEEAEGASETLANVPNNFPQELINLSRGLNCAQTSSAQALAVPPPAGARGLCTERGMQSPGCRVGGAALGV